METKLATPNVIPSRRKFLRGAAVLGGSAALLASINDGARAEGEPIPVDRKSTRLNSSH